MGIDVDLYAIGDVTDEQLAAAEEYLSARFGPHDEYDDSWLSRANYYVDRVEFNTADRFYGPGYERGSWPTIYGHIRALRAALPNCAIHYGRDVEDDCPEVTDGELEAIWQHFLGPDGNAYRDRLRA